MQRYEHGGDIYENSGILLDFSVNTNPLGMPEGAKRSIAAGIDAYERYPDTECRALRAALAEQCGVEASMILCGNGAADLIFRLCACSRPKRALTLAPTFSEYERAVELFGGKMREHRLYEGNGFMLTEEILNELTPDTDILFLCNPNNPSGRLAPPELLLRIADECAVKGILFLLDECFIDFTEGKSMIPLLSEYHNLLILNAFTKLYAMAGLRLGYLLCSDTALLSRMAMFGPAWSVSGVAQAAGLAALDIPGWAKRTQELVRMERAFLQGEFAALGLTVFPSDANFLLVKNQTPLYEVLKARHILVRSCKNFSGLDERYTRIGLKTHDKNKTLLRAIAEVLHG